MFLQVTKSAGVAYIRPVSQGTQISKTELPDDHPGAKPIPKVEVKEQASGNVKFVDDMKETDMLFGALVMGEQAPALVTGLDASAALAMPGVVDFVTVSNIAAPPNALTPRGHESTNAMCPTFVCRGPLSRRDHFPLFMCTTQSKDSYFRLRHLRTGCGHPVLQLCIALRSRRRAVIPCRVRKATRRCHGGRTGGS